MRFIQRLLAAFTLLLTMLVSAALILHIRFLSNAIDEGLVRGRRTLSTVRGRAEQNVSNVALFLSNLTLLPSGRQYRIPVSVIIENHEVARPHQRGLADALMIQEFLVEGFISRFNAIYDLSDLPHVIGPVRSLRPYFIDGALPWTNLMLFAGGSPQAFERLEELGVPAVNGLRFPDEFVRDEEVPEPHNLFLIKEGIETLTEGKALEPIAWPPYSIGALQSGSGARVIRLDFLSPLHDIEYRYDHFSQGYTRTNGGVVSDAQPNSVLILEEPVTEIGELGRLRIDLQGKGRALLFRNGTVQRGFWQKAERQSPFLFEDLEGNPMVLARGQTWITVLPMLERVSWD